MGLEDTGNHAINGHHASYQGASIQVDKWSAGCQVTANIYEDNVKAEIARSAIQYWANLFTYTLIEEKDI